MISAGWLIPAVFFGVILGCLAVGLFAGVKEPKCDSCVLVLENKYTKPKKYKGIVEPPPKHNWEMTHADRPTRSSCRSNGRRHKI